MTKWMVINNKQVAFEEGETVLEAATKADIYIPTLCARPDLPSFGACRLCIVDVERGRKYPNSCTLPASEGMVVKTETPELQVVRRNVFELILSEHPNYCIVCNDRSDCNKLRHGEVKAGRVTGCHTCSYKDRCELLTLADYFQIQNVRYPLVYRNLPLEREDPFLVRDYNLCILCARCIRACQDVLGYSAIALTNRGHDTKVGTLLGMSHVESGCVFCGHCIDVCPTGALIARSSQGIGTPDQSVQTTCVLCSEGCQMVVDVKWDKVVNVHPPYELSATRDYCVKGRFCIPALMNGQDRLKYPLIIRTGFKKEPYPVSWDEALKYAAENMKKYNPEEIGFFGSPFLTNESIFVLSKFANKISSNNIAYNDEELQQLAKRGLKVLYMSHQSEELVNINNLELLILQDIYYSPFCESASVVFPTTTFTEEEGTKTGKDFVKNVVHKSVEPPGMALPSWVITSRLAQAMELEGFSYTSLDDVQADTQKNDAIESPMVPKQALEYMGTPIKDKVGDFNFYMKAQRKLKNSKEEGKFIVKI